MLRGLIEVAAFASYDEIANYLFFVADLPDETPGVVWDLVGVDAEPLRDGCADHGGLGDHCLRSGGLLLSGLGLIGGG